MYFTIFVSKSEKLLLIFDMYSKRTYKICIQSAVIVMFSRRTGAKRLHQKGFKTLTVLGDFHSELRSVKIQTPDNGLGIKHGLSIIKCELDITGIKYGLAGYKTGTAD